ncbi:Lipoprotein signal peptidase [hydrothermal vent metagenome]|uniref:Lipoprotein signal peptidase n=1 Tax=hydrothermal vent metagenome TaxID=652676 RepID=A0A3B0Z6J4_9ZZZZ
MLKWLWLSAVVIVLDQVTKQMVTDSLYLYQSIPVFPSLNLVLAHNSGAAFSFLSDAGGWQRWFFSVIAIVVSIVIVVWITRLKQNERRLAVALSLVLGGAIGNVWDRIAHGYVVDFIDVYYGEWHWPAFNVADSAICIGAALLIIDALFNKEKQQVEKK